MNRSKVCKGKKLPPISMCFVWNEAEESDGSSKVEV